MKFYFKVCGRKSEFSDCSFLLTDIWFRSSDKKELLLLHCGALFVIEESGKFSALNLLGTCVLISRETLFVSGFVETGKHEYLTGPSPSRHRLNFHVLHFCLSTKWCSIIFISLTGIWYILFFWDDRLFKQVHYEIAYREQTNSYKVGLKWKVDKELDPSPMRLAKYIWNKRSIKLNLKDSRSIFRQVDEIRPMYVHRVRMNRSRCWLVSESVSKNILRWWEQDGVSILPFLVGRTFWHVQAHVCMYMMAIWERDVRDPWTDAVVCCHGKVDSVYICKELRLLKNHG